MAELLLAITIISNLLLAYIVFKNNTKSETNLSLAAFNLSILLWSVPNYLYAQDFLNQQQILFWMRSVFFITGFMLGFLVYFSLVFPEKSLVISKWKKLAILLPGFIIGAVSYTDVIVEGADISLPGAHIPIFGKGMIFYSLYIFLFIGLTLFNLRKKYVLSLGTQLQHQIKVISIGLVILLLPASFTNLIVVFLFKNTSLTTLGPVFSLFTFTMISYAIIKHQFLNIRLVLGRTIYYIVIAAFPFSIFFLLSWIYIRLFGSIFHPYAYLISIPVALAFVIAFNRLNSFMRNEVKSRIINPGFDPTSLAEKLSNKISKILDLEQISNSLIDTVATSLRPDGIVIAILAGKDNNSTQEKIYQTSESKLSKELSSHLVSLKSILPLYWQTTGMQTIYYNELVNPNSANGRTENIKNDLKTVMENIGARVISPIYSKDDVTGFYALGIKEADSPYTFQDKEFLDSIFTLTNAAIARSLLYGEVQDFANTLQKRVDEATQDLQNALTQLQEKRRQERDMIDVMGHELRTPITIVRNALAMLIRLGRQGSANIPDEKLNQYLEMADESTKREIRLVETLLSATKVDASRLQLTMEKVDLNDVVNDAIEGQKDMIAEKNLEIQFVLPEVPLLVYADRTRIQEVMDNFVSNAVKYTPQGSVQIAIWQQDKFAWVRVKDSGMGISEEDLPNLGKKFFRAKQHLPTTLGENNTVVRPGGTGLGLYVTFALIKMMGGKLYINSKVNEGTAFTFSVPIFENQELKQIDQTFDKNADTSPMHDHIVLNGDAPVAGGGS